MVPGTVQVKQAKEKRLSLVRLKELRNQILKHPSSPYVLWTQENRRKSGETMKESSARWNQLTEEEKKPFVERAQEENQRYYEKKTALSEADRLEYSRLTELLKNPQRIERTKNTTSSASTAAAAEQVKHVKHPLSAYNYFCSRMSKSLKEELARQQQKELKDVTFAEVVVALGQRWQQLSADEKQPYEAASERDKERYKRETAQITQEQMTTA